MLKIYTLSPLRLGTRQEYLLSPLHATLGGPSQENKARKKKWKKDKVKSSLFSDDMITHVEKPKEFTKQN